MYRKRYLPAHLVLDESGIPGRAGADAMYLDAKKRIHVLEELAGRCPGEEKPVAAPLSPPVDDEYLIECFGLAERLQERAEMLPEDTKKETAIADKFRAVRPKMCDALNAAVLSPGCGASLAALAKRHGLDAIEVEILLLLAACALGECGNIRDVENIQRRFDGRHRRLGVVQALAADGRLVASGLVTVENYFSDPKDWQVNISEIVIHPMLRKRGNVEDAWKFASQEELLDRLPLLRRAFQAAMEAVEDDDNFHCTDTRATRERDRLCLIFRNGIRADWPLAHLFTHGGNSTDDSIVLALLCEAALHGMNPAIDGDSLWKMAANNIRSRRLILPHLMEGGALRANGFIALASFGQDGDLLSEDEEAVRVMDFELTADTLRKIGVKRNRKGSEGRAPLVRLEQLVLHDTVIEAVEQAVSQAENSALMEQWGLTKKISYGRGATLLFYGPPGVGKTACAEAIAARLNKRILVADYSKIQDMWVGGTEKKISNFFRAARDGDCVLFWDEAEAMFYDRDSASHNWEIRDVNVLLQELERFDGVCILSTNRKITLDKALARRISLKVEFAVPTPEMSRRIWDKLIPPELPVGEDVDFDVLSRTRFTGGEIKNIILNASRQGMRRGSGTRLTMEDFRRAADRERQNRDLSQENRERMGFRR
jgi:hypothetical protein